MVVILKCVNCCQLVSTILQCAAPETVCVLHHADCYWKLLVSNVVLAAALLFPAWPLSNREHLPCTGAVWRHLNQPSLHELARPAAVLLVRFVRIM